MSERDILLRGAEQMDVVLSDAQVDQLLAYLGMLLKWNKVYNLISRRDSDNLVALHLLDSLSVLPYINGPRVIDVGTGAGLPGMPLAIMRPDCGFTLLDSNGKKGRFRTQAAIELGLKNVTVVSARAEGFDPGEGFDNVMSRAFATLADMLNVAGHMVAKDGCFLAMKGVYPEQEMAELPAGFSVGTVHELRVPELNADRHLVVIRREDS